LDPARKAGRDNPSYFEMAGTAGCRLVPRAFKVKRPFTMERGAGLVRVRP
jgi:hypothetical protein